MLIFSQNGRNCENPSKLKKLWKPIKIEQKLSKKPCFLKVFQILFNFGRILSLQLTKAVFSLVLQIFHHPWHPWGCVNSGDIIDLRFVFDIFVQRHLVIFSFFWNWNGSELDRSMCKHSCELTLPYEVITGWRAAKTTLPVVVIENQKAEWYQWQVFMSLWGDTSGWRGAVSTLSAVVVENWKAEKYQWQAFMSLS